MPAGFRVPVPALLPIEYASIDIVRDSDDGLGQEDKRTRVQEYKSTVPGVVSSYQRS
jgi:hypothetical protein